MSSSWRPCALARLKQYQQDTERQLAELQAAITERLSTLQATRSAWAAERERVATEAGQLFGLPDPAKIPSQQTVDNAKQRSAWTTAAAELGADALATLQALPYGEGNPVHFPSGRLLRGLPLSEDATVRHVALGKVADGPVRSAVYAGLQAVMKDQPHAFTVPKW